MEQLTRSTFHLTVVKAILIVLAIIFVEGAIMDYFRSFDVCMADRFAQDSQILFNAQQFFNRWVFRFGVVALLIFPLVLTFWKNDTTPSTDFWRPSFSVSWNTLFACTYTLLWYGSTYCLIDAAKEILLDKTCSTKNNSISGHFSFFLFYLFTLPHLALSLLPFDKKQFPSSKDILSPNSPFTFKLCVLTLSYLCFFFSAVFTLYHTYFWGYHSLRQVYLGAFIGIASHWGVSELLKAIDRPHPYLKEKILSRLSPREKKKETTGKEKEKEREKEREREKDTTRKSKGGLNIQEYFKDKPINSDTVMALLKGRLLPLTTLAVYIVVSAFLALLFTGQVPYSSIEWVLMGLGFPLVCYTYIVQLNGRFQFRRKALKND